MFEALALMLIQTTMPTKPQSGQATTTQPTTILPDNSDDIVVTGLRDLDDPRSAVTRRTLGSLALGEGAVASREVFAQSQRFVKCAFNVYRRPDALLHDILDGTINSARQRSAQERFVQINGACAQNPSVAIANGLAASSAWYDTSYYDRGAIVLDVLQRYAPNLGLTRKQTMDPVVVARFNAREATRARFRLATDRRYFEVAVCLTRAQPNYAVRLVKPRLSTDAINRLEAAMVNASRECVGYAPHVYFDATQFRFYIADAVYRWAVAAKGVDSLIPPV